MEERLVSSRELTERTFTAFFSESEPILRHALIASCGPEIGREAAADAFEYAWANWDRIESMEHPVGYLYRVGRSAARRYRRVPVVADRPAEEALPWFEPNLEPELQRLSDRQRTAVVLKHSFGCTYEEISRVLGISIPTVQKHAERALAKLRRRLEVTS